MRAPAPDARVASEQEWRVGSRGDRRASHNVKGRNPERDQIEVPVEVEAADPPGSAGRVLSVRFWRGAELRPYRSTGRPVAAQWPKPPRTFITCRYPFARSRLAPMAERAPDWH